MRSLELLHLAGDSSLALRGGKRAAQPCATREATPRVGKLNKAPSRREWMFTHL
jgi:hypothetical protein